MTSKHEQDRKDAKRNAVVAKLKELHPSLDMLSGMWEEKTLDQLILALGIGQVSLTE